MTQVRGLAFGIKCDFYGLSARAKNCSAVIYLIEAARRVELLWRKLARVMLSLMKYDDASWHYGADNFPKELPQRVGATHTGMFVAWTMLSGIPANLRS